MKIGIIADSHDRLSTLKKAIKILKMENVEFLLHAGDIIAPFVVPILAESGVPVYAVYGNNDGERKGLKEAFAKYNLRIEEPPFCFIYKDLRITLFHEFSENEFDAKENDLIVFGHTHKPEIVEGNPLILNPGELCGWVYGRSTFMLLDTVNMETVLKEV